MRGPKRKGISIYQRMIDEINPKPKPKMNTKTKTNSEAVTGAGNAVESYIGSTGNNWIRTWRPSGIAGLQQLVWVKLPWGRPLTKGD